MIESAKILLVGLVTAPLTGWGRVDVASSMSGVDVELIAWEVKFRSDPMAEALGSALTLVASDVVINVSADLDESMWSMIKIVLVSMPVLSSSEEKLLFGCEEGECCPIAECNCRSLQAEIPSYHV